MDYKELKEVLCEWGKEEVVLFEDPNYASAFIGLSDDDRAVYSYEKMIEYLVRIDNISEEDAIDFIEYNTIRALPYFENAPIVVYDTYWNQMN